MFKSLVLGAAVGFGLFVFADYAFSVPTVKMSYSTNTCVEVENYTSTFFGTTAYNCENMPTKFNHVWVQ